MKRISLLFVALSFALLAACDDEPERERCSECGMFVAADSDWTVTSGETLYDTPKCAFRAEGSDEALRFREYYGSGSRPGAALRFVTGSDVEGPMGVDLVPVAPDRVEHFIRDHGGEALEFTNVDAALLETLRP